MGLYTEKQIIEGLSCTDSDWYQSILSLINLKNAEIENLKSQIKTILDAEKFS